MRERILARTLAERTRRSFSTGGLRVISYKTIFFRNPATFRDEREIGIRDDVRAVGALNEFEFVDGSVYANIWQSDRVARIDPESDAVTGWLDLSSIAEREHHAGEVDVANGIARDGHTLYVTGKLWRSVYGLELLR